MKVPSEVKNLSDEELHFIWHLLFGMTLGLIGKQKFVSVFLLFCSVLELEILYRNLLNEDELAEEKTKSYSNFLLVKGDIDEKAKKYMSEVLKIVKRI